MVFTPSQQTVKLSPQEQQAVVAQNKQWQQRATQLDGDNQELESLLAQSRQQIQLLRDEVRATRDELKTTTDQLAATNSKNQVLEKRTQALAASVQRRAGAEIRPNNGLVRDLAFAHLQGVTVRPDGDVVRVEIASDQLFQAASPQFSQQARTLLRSVASELTRHYPRQLIGVEAHTSRNLIRTSEFPSNHHLSVAQAMAVYDLLVRDARVPAEQLFVVGHGPNHPRASNGTPAGQAKNRRIELVIYPETVQRR
jgi:flagellar motor protein MotB